MTRHRGTQGLYLPRFVRPAIRSYVAGIASGKPYLIDANIGGDLNPPGAVVWELPGIGTNRPAIGERYIPGK